MPGCEINSEHPSAGVIVVAVRGSCTKRDAASLGRALTAAMRAADRVVVDLSEAEAMDATSLYVLLDNQRDAVDRGLDVVAVLREDAALTGRTSVDLAAIPTAMPTFATREQALRRP